MKAFRTLFPVLLLGFATPALAGDVTVTIGNDEATADALAAMGGTHADHAVSECHVDGDNRLVTAPAYMYDTTIDQVAIGIEKAVNTVIEMA